MFFGSLDGDRFPAIYQKFRKPIFRYVSQRVRDEETAEEITQEVFLKAFRARESYLPSFGISTWLWTIAKNTLSDWHRKNKDSPILDAHAGMHEELLCPAPSAEVALTEQGERGELLQRMARLTDLQKNVLILRVIHHLPYREIAQRLGLSLSAAKCLFYRAKSTLGEGLGAGLPALA
jgi:RNA polymerase sigma-70 factor (ECF subfamily)